MKKIIFYILLSFLVPVAANAAGPQKVAKSDRSLWPVPIATQSDFDFASAHEILIFCEKLDEIENNLKNETALREYLGREKVNFISVQKYLQNTKKLMKEKQETVGFIKYEIFPENLTAWKENTDAFYENYLYEQIRLAALFPEITSEIDTLDDVEIKGDKMKDLNFILTFDDGPSLKGGNTDKLIATLKEHQKPAIFFVLGDNFVKRNDVQSLYKDFLVGSHGKTHKPHTKPEFFENSLSFTAEKIEKDFPQQEVYYFRPPYGQRSVETIEYLEKHDWNLMLWNIDSQDWSNKMTAEEVKDRIITLMLLWRSGIILFHDIHPKANKILPEIFDMLEHTDVNFR
ncbi:MAG: polysaccharide deacetylase family protein [Alphaproteobacteria bacterium]